MKENEISQQPPLGGKEDPLYQIGGKLKTPWKKHVISLFKLNKDDFLRKYRKHAKEIAQKEQTAYQHSRTTNIHNTNF